MTGILWCRSCSFTPEHKVICFEAVDCFEWRWVTQSFGTREEDIYDCTGMDSISCEYSLSQKQRLVSNNYFKILSTASVFTSLNLNYIYLKRQTYPKPSIYTRFIKATVRVVLFWKLEVFRKDQICSFINSFGNEICMSTFFCARICPKYLNHIRK